MLSVIFTWLVHIAFGTPLASHRIAIADTLSVSGSCWDVSTGVNLKSVITTVSGRRKITVAESDAQGQFRIQLPDSVRELSFEVAGYPVLTLPVRGLGKIEKEATFRIDLPMILPDSQRITKPYLSTQKPGGFAPDLKPGKGAKKVYLHVRNARNFQRLRATVCLTPAKTGRTHCHSIDSTKAPAFVWLNPGENLSVEVRADGHETYRGTLNVGATAEEEYCQIKLLHSRTMLAVFYDDPEKLNANYEIQNTNNRQKMSRFSHRLTYFDWNHFKPGEEYQFVAYTADGTSVLNEPFSIEPGLNFKVIRPRKPVTTAIRDESMPTRFFDSTVLYFDQSAYTLRKESKGKLDSISWLMINQRGLIAELTGHTDNVGKRDLNLTLSEYRTRVVARYLQQKGIPLSRLSPNWKGPNSPAAPNDSEANKTKNRRVVVRLLAR